MGLSASAWHTPSPRTSSFSFAGDDAVASGAAGGRREAAQPGHQEYIQPPSGGASCGCPPIRFFGRDVLDDGFGSGGLPDVSTALKTGSRGVGGRFGESPLLSADSAVSCALPRPSRRDGGLGYRFADDARTRPCPVW